jgi:hypothetical protein
VPSKKREARFPIDDRSGMKMTPTIGAPPGEVKAMRGAKGAPDESASVKPRRAKARFIGDVPKKSVPQNSASKDRLSRGKS